MRKRREVVRGEPREGFQEMRGERGRVEEFLNRFTGEGRLFDAFLDDARARGFSERNQDEGAGF